MEVIKTFIVQNKEHVEQLYLLSDGTYALNKTFYVSTGTYMSIITFITWEKAEELMLVKIDRN